MAIPRKLKITVLVLGSFLSLVGGIGFLASRQVLTPQQAGLMAVALFGMYVGFGILIAVYRLIARL